MPPHPAPPPTAEVPNRAPGPKGTFLLGSLPQMRRGGFTFMRELQQRYGDVVRFRIGPIEVHLVSSVSGIKHVLQDNYRNYVKSRAFEKVKALVGEGLLTSEGDFWLRQRRLAQPAFHKQRIEGFARTMTDETTRMLASWEVNAEKGEPFDVSREMTALTLTIVTRTLFSSGLSQQEIDTVARVLPPLLAATVARTNMPLDFLERLPTPGNRRFAQYRAELDRIVYRVIEARRASGETPGDLLGMLMEARDEESGEHMSDTQLRDEAITLFLAGHETTANLLSWAWMLLSQHPEVRARLEEEVDRVLQGRVPTAVDARALDYTNRVIQETQRHYPSVWATGRRALADDVIDAYRMPAGKNVILNFYNLHHHPAYWDEPMHFDPDRFLPERSEGRPKHAFVPFGAGPRMCIGNTFALMEAALVLATVAQRYRLELASTYPIAIEASATFRPKHGVWMTAQRRH
jgi:cytochrome P450